MHDTLHVESHFTASELVRDIVIGMSDGLTVPFALAAGLSGSNLATAVVVTAGLAEVAAGSIAMGLGGYLAARSDAEHYVSEKRREEIEVVDLPDVEREEVAVVFREYGLTEAEIEPILMAFEKNHAAWVDFMMRFELGLEEPDPRRALKSAATIAGAYIAGGLIPLAPYMVVKDAHDGLLISVVVTAVGAGNLRLYQGAIHRHASGSQRAAHHAHRRAGRRGRLPHRPDVLRALKSVSPAAEAVELIHPAGYPGRRAASCPERSRDRPAESGNSSTCPLDRGCRTS